MKLTNKPFRSVIRMNIGIRSGATRHVLLIGSWAIKVPAFMNGWELFLCGLLGNVQERKFSGVEEVFCPVLFYVWGGFLSVMRRAEPMSDTDFDAVVTDEFLAKWECDIPCEIKVSSFGWIDGNPVCVDYGS